MSFPLGFGDSFEDFITLRVKVPRLIFGRVCDY